MYPPQKAAKEFGGEIFTAKFQLVFEPPSNTLNNSNNSNGGISQEDYDTIAAAARSAVFGIMPKQSRQDLSINVVKIFEDQLKLAETEKVGFYPDSQFLLSGVHPVIHLSLLLQCFPHILLSFRCSFNSLKELREFKAYVNRLLIYGRNCVYPWILTTDYIPLF